MKFAIAVNMERLDPSQDMVTLNKNALELVKLAEQGGFETAFAAEHHTIEMTVAPNPFLILAHWGEHTSRIRLGTATVVAPYWHPIRLAGEAAYTDILIDGRLELGIARGAFQYEFSRMAPGIKDRDGAPYLKEIVPAIKALWEGDYAHEGQFWSFPTSTSAPKPLQKPHPPIWIAARDPDTFDWAVKNGANIMSTPLSRPPSEVTILGERLRATLRNNPTVPRPRFMMLRSAAVLDKGEDWRVPVDAAILHGRHFENLFRTDGVVRNGFTQPMDISAQSSSGNYDAEQLRESLLIGTPDEVVEKLGLYEAAGVDLFCYGANIGLPFKQAVRSLELFIERVMPHFAEPGQRPGRASQGRQAQAVAAV
ncbi:alkanesulfonate monooxygenase SsuD/methylene tetrahydromethanopterin reductase-like flavin-dependent oxidoreductase (luciferase family) [Rhodoligotrophos appendicifer]|uniref:LLM class flavin-dependent oxidoreductase n=1 Tax=Rhodoligotrophos appendicifer TaxID=987056 RepID=UPI001180DFC7|nr:LLM class flavin-dependent oxidoreductase [Rhodoligotrophos appendicifer]